MKHCELFDIVINNFMTTYQRLFIVVKVNNLCICICQGVEHSYEH